MQKVTTSRPSGSELRPYDNGFAVIVLAAGASPGRGRPRQLNPYLGRTLVEHAARTALASGACEVVVVVGDHLHEIRHELRRLPVRVVHNRYWEEGIASSIRAGISQLSDCPRAAIISLCDQVKVTPAHLRALGERVLAADGSPIVASSYDGVLGAPCAFSRRTFPALLALVGMSGARDLIRGAGASIEAIQFANANEEVDIPSGYHPLQGQHPDDPVVDRCQDSSEARAPPAARHNLIAV